MSYLEDHLIHSLIKGGRHQTICLTSVAVQETEPCLGDVCINVANPPQCHLVNQPPWGKADQDADGLTGAFFLSVLIIYAHAAWLTGGLCAFRGGVLVFVGLTGAVLITVMGAQCLETRTGQTGLGTQVSGDCLVAALAAS